jgi:hypothetical protein
MGYRKLGWYELRKLCSELVFDLMKRLKKMKMLEMNP